MRKFIAVLCFRWVGSGRLTLIDACDHHSCEALNLG
jgi:hypothetical protein